MFGPVTPGQLSSLSVGFGSGAGADLTFDNKTYTHYPSLAADVKYLSYRADLFPVSVRDLLEDRSSVLPWMDLVFCFNIEARGTVYHVAGPIQRNGAQHDINKTSVAAALPLGLVADFQALPGLHVQPGVGYELLGGLGKLRDVAGSLAGVEGADYPVAGQPLQYGLAVKFAAPRLLFAKASYRAAQTALGDQPINEQLLQAGGGLYF